MAYQKGPYTTFASLPVPPQPDVHTARSIDFKVGQIEIDTQTGGFLGMPPNSQRVALLISFEVEMAKFITPQEQSRTRRRILKVLEPLTGGKNPLIQIVSIQLGSDRAGVSFRRVAFRDLTKNDPNVVQTVTVA